jgi:hypothetical protein
MIVTNRGPTRRKRPKPAQPAEIAASVARAVDAPLTGTVATQLPQATKFVGVRVRIPDAISFRRPLPTICLHR